MTKKWYDIKSVSKNNAEILIYGEIGEWGITAKNFAIDLKNIGNKKVITVRISSVGGSIIDGNAIYTTLKNNSAKINVEIDSVALSMGSVIAMAGDHIAMAENALMMIHNPHGGSYGDSNEMRKTADVMDKMKDTLITAYTNKTGLDTEILSTMMSDETWMNAEEAKDLGFIDEITGAVETDASFDFSKFKNVPKQLLIDSLKTESVIQPSAKADKTQKVKKDMPDKIKTETDATAKVDVKEIQAKATAKALADEKVRRSDIRSVFEFAGRDHGELMDSCLDDVTITVNASRKLLLDAIGIEFSPLSKDNRVTVGEDSRDKFLAGAGQAIIARAGLDKRDSKSEFNGATLVDIAKAALRASNISYVGMGKMQIVGAAFTHTSSDFPLLLENSIGKQLQAAYGHFKETWSQIATTGSVPDFKQNSRIRLGSFNSLDTILEADEYTSGSFGEEKEMIQAKTKGKLISLTRQMIINDDLNGFMRIASLLGRAAARTVGNDVYSVLLSNPVMSDGSALFHAKHSNLAAAASAMSVVTLGAARTKMRLQKDLDSNDYLDIHPSVLLTSVALEDTANTLMSDETDPSQNNSKKKNPVRGMATVVTDPRLDAVSSTAWYLFASPSDVPTLEVAFLDGNQTPYIESEEGFTVDGVRMKVRLDYGVAATDYRGAYKNSGL